MFKICDNKGFHTTFANGNTISVQFGPGNYCDNHMASLFNKSPASSTTAEIGAWNKECKWIDFPDGEQVLEWINRLASE